MNKRYLFCLGLLLAAISLFSYSLTDTAFGNRILSFDARSMAMGNTGMTNGARPMNAHLNPAVAAMMTSKIAAQFSLGSTQLEETRSLPFYNSFDNYIADAVYAANTHGFADYSGAINTAVHFGSSTCAIGVEFMPVVDFSSKYREEVRNNFNSDSDTYPELIARNFITNKGKLNSTGINWSYMIQSEHAKMSFGFKYAALTGNNEQETKIRWSDWAIRSVITPITGAAANVANPGHNILPDYTKRISRDFHGSQIQLGWIGQIADRLTLGFRYTTKTDLAVNNTFKSYQQIAGETDITNLAKTATDSLITKDFTIPSSYRMGFSYTPRNIMRTVFNAEVEVVNWYETDKHFDRNVLNYSVGIEHGITGRFPLRLGYSTETTFQTVIDHNIFYANKIITPTLSAGTGYALSDKVYFDFAVAYSFRTFEALDLFKDTYYNDKQYNDNAATYLLWVNSSHPITIADRGWENPDAVRETFVKVLASITYTW
jgi:hypothetical protein